MTQTPDPDRVPTDLLERYRAVRSASTALAAPLSPEDCLVQSMPDVSPTKWHLAHTTWFFETFVLASAGVEYRSPEPAYAYLFNSYYQGVGPQFDRPRRGLLSRPSLAEVYAYRSLVDDALTTWLAEAAPSDPLLDVVLTGIHHEQQHQELILTDIKHVLWQNPLRPRYREASEPARERAASSRFIAFEGGLVEIGHQSTDFCFDNELPRHRAFIHPFELASRPVTAGEYRQFIEDGGYRRPELWLSDGWTTVRREGWEAPLYWMREGTDWQLFTLGGLRPLTSDEPVCHVSYFEADAFARFSGARLPTEFEWELAAALAPTDGNFVESGRYHPSVTRAGGGPCQLFGDVWEWTASAYAPYPGYRAPEGALGEYNGKFMCSQQVLRGGSCATPRSHIRATYRNFFYPDQRWQFSGLRLARDVIA